LSVVTLRSNKEQVEEDLAASGAADLSDGAYVCFRQGDMDRAERLARSATRASPDAGAPLALLAWIEATRPNNTSHDETRKRIIMLDKALRLDPMLEQAHYWRGLLHKRLDNHSLAMGNFRRVVELNPKHIDAQRELRVYEMRIRRNSISMKSVK
jgi:tetratricopeptide (TPR) repeat protein